MPPPAIDVVGTVPAELDVDPDPGRVVGPAVVLGAAGPLGGDAAPVVGLPVDLLVTVVEVGGLEVVELLQAAARSVNENNPPATSGLRRNVCSLELRDEVLFPTVRVSKPAADQPWASGRKEIRPTVSRPSRVPYVAVVPSDRILLVEDDERIGSTLLRALEGSGYETRWERTGAAGARAAAESRPDLVLLDLGLPDIDGLDVCRTIHERDAALPIVMLTARDEELDVVVGLDAGAIDYITKPFKLGELLARLRAQLRRIESTESLSLEVGDLRLDRNARRAWMADHELELRAKEFDLLARLVADAGNAVTRESLMADVWDENWFGSTKTLDFHIGSLRRKLDRPDQASRITTLRSIGYRYELG